MDLKNKFFKPHLRLDGETPTLWKTEAIAKASQQNGMVIRTIKGGETGEQS